MLSGFRRVPVICILFLVLARFSIGSLRFVNDNLLKITYELYQELMLVYLLVEERDECLKFLFSPTFKSKLFLNQLKESFHPH